jgi:uncharacterized membrane-anchored protein YitT (DUF2179 family)
MPHLKLAVNGKIRTRLNRLQNIKDAVFIVVGVCLATIGLKGFLLPNGFLDGGTMGVALLSNRLLSIDLSVLIVLINAPFIFLGAKLISRNFAFKSAIAIILLSTLVHFVTFDQITSDKLLISVFGGFFLGAGIALSIRGGAVIDGSEVLAIKMSRESSITIGDFIAIFNVILFIVAMSLINIETAMYSMLTYFTAAKTVEFIINGIEEYIGVMVVSEHPEAIKKQIISQIGRGITVFKAEPGFGSSGISKSSDGKVLFCVVTRLEVSKLLLEIEKIDSAAFVVQYPIKATKGGMIKKRPLH